MQLCASIFFSCKMHYSCWMGGGPYGNNSSFLLFMGALWQQKSCKDSSLYQVIKVSATWDCHWVMMFPWLVWLGASSRTFLKVLKGWSQKVFGVSTFSTNVCSESICSPYVNFALDLNLFYRWQAITRTLRNCLRTQRINTLGSLCTDAKNTEMSTTKLIN